MPISFKKNLKKAPEEEAVVEEAVAETKPANTAGVKMKLKPKVKTPEDIITDNSAEENLKESGLAHTLVEKSHMGKVTEVVENKTEIQPQSKAMTINQMARVSVTLGTKINMGYYNSVNVSVTVTLPCEVEAIDEVFEFATGWTSERVEQLVNKATEQDPETDASDE